jgi:hypothetical protein
MNNEIKDNIPGFAFPFGRLLDGWYFLLLPLFTTTMPSVTAGVIFFPEFIEVAMNSGKKITPAVTLGIVVVNKGNNKNYQPSSNLPKGKAKPGMLSLISLFIDA